MAKMTDKQHKNLKETIFTMSCEGLDPTAEEVKVLVDVLEGRRSYNDVIKQYIAEAHSYAGV